jgi:hypothetical protein
MGRHDLDPEHVPPQSETAALAQKADGAIDPLLGGHPMKRRCRYHEVHRAGFKAHVENDGAGSGGHCSAACCSRVVKRSAGVAHPRVLRGRSLSSWATATR